MSATNRTAPFSFFAIIAVVVVASVGFISMMFLSAYAPEYRQSHDGGAHAYSTSAVGFVGITELVRAVRGERLLIRNEGELRRGGLVVLTPSLRNGPEELKGILERRRGQPTLIVMPKWVVSKLPSNPAWVRAEGMLPAQWLTHLLSGVTDAQFSSPEQGELRSIHGQGLNILDTTPEGQPLLVAIEDTETYILADADVLDNKGVATRSGAERAMAMLEKMAPPNESIGFDVTLSGLADTPNLLKLAFERPFLPLTLCLLAAAMLAGLQAMRRFGPAAHDERVLAFGKRALAENGAALLRIAKRRHRTGARYAAMTRDAVATASGAPSSLTGEALDRYLDKLGGDGEPFDGKAEPYTILAERAAAAPDTRRLLAAARDLYHWRRTVTREHR